MPEDLPITACHCTDRARHSDSYERKRGDIQPLLPPCWMHQTNNRVERRTRTNQKGQLKREKIHVIKCKCT